MGTAEVSNGRKLVSAEQMPWGFVASDSFNKMLEAVVLARSPLVGELLSLLHLLILEE